MARPRHFNRFALDLGSKVHDFSRDVCRLVLVSVPPLPTNRERKELAELPEAGGYEQGGKPVEEQSWDEEDGIATCGGDPVTWTATGRIAPVRAAVLCNGDVLVCWWEQALPLALEEGDTFTVPFEGRKIFSVG